MAVEIISRSISTKVWDRAGIQLETPGSSVRHVTNCATRPDRIGSMISEKFENVGHRQWMCRRPGAFRYTSSSPMRVANDAKMSTTNLIDEIR